MLENGLPATPGIYRVTYENGVQNDIKVRDYNGKLIAIVGDSGFFSRAVPVEDIQGQWSEAR